MCLKGGKKQNTCDEKKERKLLSVEGNGEGTGGWGGEGGRSMRV